MLPQSFLAPWRWTILSCSSRPDLFCKYGTGGSFHIKGGSRAVISRSAYGVFRQLGENIDLICFASRSGNCSANTGTFGKCSASAVARVGKTAGCCRVVRHFRRLLPDKKAKNPAASIIMIMAIIIIFVVLFINYSSVLVVFSLKN